MKHEETTAEPFLPHRRSLPALKAAAKWCRGCELYEGATQTVFGEGDEDASIVFVGEQPGDVEDRNGLPFVGPSGQLLREVMEEVGIPYGKVYITNAVKHFYWKPGHGKRRMHQTPLARHIRACKPWLEAELEVIRPEILVCLGATALHAITGKAITIASLRGDSFATPYCTHTFVTTHPSALLRIPDHAARVKARDAFTEDLKLVAEYWRSLKLPKAG